jgi:hypothetical protein
MDIMDDREIQEAEELKKTSPASKKKFVYQVALLVGVGLLSCFFAFPGNHARFYVLASLLGLLGAYLLWPLTILVVAYMFFMMGWLIWLLGIAIWVFCIWRLWKAKKWTVYFGIGAFLTLTAVFFFMIFSIGESTIAAEVSTITTDLRGMKAASLMYKTDQNDDLSDLSESENHVAVLAPYMDNPGKYTDPRTAYSFRVMNGVGWVGYSLDRAEKSPAVYEKLEGRAATVGLLKSPTIDVPSVSFMDSVTLGLGLKAPALDVPPVSDDVTHRYTKDAKVVWIRAF